MIQPLVLLLLLTGLLVLTPAPASALTPDERELVRRALNGTTDDSWQWSAKLMRSVEEPVLVDYVTWLRLRARDERMPFRAYVEFLQQHPDWPSQAEVQARAEESIDETVSHAERLAFFQKREPRTRQGRTRLAEALIANGRSPEANVLLRRTWIDDDFGDDEADYFLGTYGQHLRREDHAARLDRLLWDGKARAARRMYPMVDAGRRALAEARLRLQVAEGGVDAALAAVPAAFAADPGLLFDRTRWRRLKGRDDDVRAVLLDPPDERGHEAAWWNERSIQVRRALSDRDFKTAYQLARRHRLDDGPSFAEAEWLSGWIALRFIGDPTTAARHFRRMGERVRTPISRGRAAYWTGRAMAAAGNKDQARVWYGEAATNPTSFYGQLAAENLGLGLVGEAGPMVKIGKDSRRSFEAREPVRLTRLLCEVGAFDRVGPFLNRLASDSAGDPVTGEMVYELAQSCRRPELMLRAAKSAALDGYVDLRATHPVPQVKSFLKPVPGHPEPALLLAVARQESLFDPKAKSPAGAMGMMQLMPATAKAMASDLGLGFAPAKLLSDPDFNIQLGGHYLSRQLARFDGTEILAIAAYNAGPSRVSQWLGTIGDPRGRGTEQLVDWIEQIPFAETRNYVQRVLEGKMVYRLVLANQNLRTLKVGAPGGAREAEVDQTGRRRKS